MYNIGIRHLCTLRSHHGPSTHPAPCIVNTMLLVMCLCCVLLILMTVLAEMLDCWCHLCIIQACVVIACWTRCSHSLAFIFQGSLLSEISPWCSYGSGYSKLCPLVSQHSCGLFIRVLNALNYADLTCSQAKSHKQMRNLLWVTDCILFFPFQELILFLFLLFLNFTLWHIQVGPPPPHLQLSSERLF